MAAGDLFGRSSRPRFCELKLPPGLATGHMVGSILHERQDDAGPHFSDFSRMSKYNS